MSKKKRNKQTNQTLARNELSPAVFSTSFPIAYVIDDIENTFPIQLEIIANLCELDKALNPITTIMPIVGKLYRIRFNELLFEDRVAGKQFKTIFIADFMKRHHASTRFFGNDGIMLFASNLSNEEFATIVDGVFDYVYELFTGKVPV